MSAGRSAAPIRAKATGAAGSTSSSAPEKRADASQHPGFVNLGNTCFLNSTLQALAATQKLRELYEPDEAVLFLLSNGGAEDLKEGQNGVREHGTAVQTPQRPAIRLETLSPFKSPSQQPQAQDLAQLAAARSKSPVIKLADEEHGRGPRSDRRTSTASSAKADTHVDARKSEDRQPARPDASASSEAAGPSKQTYEPKASEIPLNTAFRHVMEKSWKSPARPSSAPPSSSASKAAAVNPKQLLSAISRKYGHYSEYRQQDGHELLRHLLDSLRMEELDVIKKMSAPSTPSPDKGKRRSVPNEEASQWTPLVDNLFCGKLLSAVVCEGCGQVSHTYEDFFDVSLSLRSEQDAATASRRQRIRGMADRWRRGAPQRNVSGEARAQAINDALELLRHNNTESLSDTEQTDGPVKRSASRAGRSISRPRSAADMARIDANSRESAKKFIRKQVQASEDASLESDVENLSLEEGRRTPREPRSRLASGSLLRAMSGRKSSATISRSSSPNVEVNDAIISQPDQAHAGIRRHGGHFAHLDYKKRRGSRQQRYLSRLLAEAPQAPQPANIGALLWGRRSAAGADEGTTAAHVTTEGIESRQASTGLVRALNQFTSVEVLDGANMYACKRCWRLLNPPTKVENEKQRLRKLRRGKHEDDSERSSDDKSSSDEEEKEKRQRLDLINPSAPSTLSSSSSSSLSEGDASLDRASSLSKGASSDASEKRHNGVVLESRDAAVEPPSSEASSPPMTARPSDGTQSASTSQTFLKAPRPVKAPLQLGSASSDGIGSTNDSSDEELSDAARKGSSKESPEKQRMIRYADEEAKPNQANGAQKEDAAPSEKAKTLRRKRSAHSLQRRALKRYLIAERPRVLVFHLKRFQATGRTFGTFSNSYKKIDDNVSFPEYLDVKQWVAPPREEYDRHGRLKRTSDARTLERADGEDGSTATATPTAMAGSEADESKSSIEQQRKPQHHHRHHLHWRSRMHRRSEDSKHGEDGMPATRTLYRLYAVVVHQGGMSGGHYTSYVLSDRAIGARERKGSQTDVASTGKPRGSFGSDAAGSASEREASSPVTTIPASESSQSLSMPASSRGSVDAGTPTTSVSSQPQSKGLAANPTPVSASPHKDDHLQVPSTDDGLTSGTSASPASSASSAAPAMQAVPSEQGSVTPSIASSSRRGSAVAFTDSPSRTSMQHARDTRRWVYTSDTSVRLATIDEVLKAQAYMLFYEQV